MFELLAQASPVEFDPWKKGIEIGVITALISALVYGVRSIERINQENNLTHEKISKLNNETIRDITDKNAGRLESMTVEHRSERLEDTARAAALTDRVHGICDELITVMHDERRGTA